jgi:calpain-15
VLIEDGITADDIRQGQTGNCYFCAAIAAIASRYPKLIENLFISKETNDQGVYGLRLVKDGLLTDVILDDYFPTDGLEPYSAKHVGTELWWMFVEKAYAKSRGSYDRMEGGQ